MLCAEVELFYIEEVDIPSLANQLSSKYPAYFCVIYQWFIETSVSHFLSQITHNKSLSISVTISLLCLEDAIAYLASKHIPQMP